jgi:hypothetical protein
VFFFVRLVSEGALRSSTGYQYHGAGFHSMVVAANVMEAEIRGLAMVVRVWAAITNWLGDS